jgi:hypothetical protein
MARQKSKQEATSLNASSSSMLLGAVPSVPMTPELVGSRVHPEDVAPGYSLLLS